MNKLYLLRHTSFLFLTLLLCLFTTTAYGQTYYNMSSGNYLETFTGWSGFSTNWNGLGVLNTGTIPAATKTTTSTTGTMGVVGTSTAIGYDASTSTKLVFLTTGTSDNSAAVACDLNLNFTNRTAGTVSFDAATIFNSTGNRVSSLKLYYSIDGTSWTEITGTNLPYVATNNVAGSASISVALPSAITNQSTVKLRFYEHNGSGGSTGSRPKISIDNVAVTSSPICTTSQSISGLATTDTRTYGDASYTLGATASSGLTVTYTSSDPTVASISGNTVTILKAGTTTITASQSGNSTYCAATNVTQTLTINKKDLSITGLSANDKIFDGNTTATLSGTPALNGVLAGDVSNVTLGGTPVANFNDASVNCPKPVTVTGYTISGSASANYNLLQPSGLTACIIAPTNAITLSPATQPLGPFCNSTSNNISLTYNITGTVNSPAIELSTSSGAFPGTTLSNTSISGSGPYTISADIPASQAAGTAYRVRIKSTDPVYSLDNNSNITITAATTPSVSITSSPAAVSGTTTVCSGTSVTFTATPNTASLGGGTVSATGYQWKKNGSNIPGETASTYTTTTLASGDVISCLINVTGGCVTSNTATSGNITMVINPILTPSVSISSSDADNTICLGTSVTFTPSPTNGGTSPTYTWWKNGIGTGTNLGTSTTYTTTTLANADAIACVMTSNAVCASPATANSNSITTTVNALPNTPSNPTAADNPACAPTTLNPMTPASGETWFWQGTSNNGNNTGQNTSTPYAISGPGTATYYVRAQNNTTLCWSSGSGSVSVTINTPPSIGSGGQPANQTVNASSSATFSVSNISGAVSGYQWQLSTNNGSSWNDISGATLASYNTGATNTGMTGYQYRCIVKGTSPCADAISNAAILTVNAGPCFSEDFASASAGNSTSTSGSSSTWSGNSNFSVSGNVYQAGGAIRMGTGSGSGGITTTTNALNGVSGNITFSVDVKGWSTVETGLTVTLNGVSQYITYTQVLAGTFETKTLSFTSVPNNSTLSISTTNNGRVFIDNVKLFCQNGPEINLKQSSNNIANNTGSYDFGNQTVALSSSPVTFTIENIGTGVLALSGSPKIEVLGSQAGDFSVDQSLTSATVAANNGTTTFSVTFTPSVAGPRSATIRIANDDDDENPYQFTISGNGTYQNNSDIIATSGYTYTENHDYTLYQASPVSTTSNSVGVFKFTIRDGGAAAADTDGKSTKLTAITFNVTNLANIRSAALFGGTSQNSLVSNTATIDVGAGTITFSGINNANAEAANNSTKDITLRVSYLTTVTDNQQLQYTIASATADLAGSLFAATNAGGATSSTLNDRNRIEVTATKLTFSTISNGAIDVNLTPFTISAQDNNNNIDLDVNGTITLDCPNDVPNGSLSVSGGPYALTNGVSNSISGVKFADVQSSITLTATLASPSLSGTSNTFDIALISFANNAFLSITGSGSYTNANSWCKCGNTGGCVGLTPNSGGWSATGVSGTPTAASTVIIQGTITLSSSLGVTNSTILSGGNLIVNAQHPISNSMTVKTGGTLTINDNLNFNSSSAVFEVEDGGTVIIDYYWNNDPTPPIWAGIEKFRPQSNLIIRNWDSRIYLADGNVTANTYNGKTAMFGNIYYNPGQDPTSSNGAYNLGIARQNWDMLGPNNTSPIEFTHGTIEFVKTAYNTAIPEFKNVRIMGNPNTSIYDVNIHGSLKLSSTWSSAGAVWGATKGNFTLNIDSNVVVSSGSLAVRSSQSSTGNTTMNISGNLTVGGTSLLLLNQNQYADPGPAPFQKAILNLKGNLTVASGAYIVSGSPYRESEFNFNGTTTQLVNVASPFGGISSTYRAIPIAVKDGAYVQLNTNNLLLNDSTSFTVEGGGTLDFGFDAGGTNPLYIGQPTSNLIGNNSFIALERSILKITSPDGLYDEWDRPEYTSAGVTINTGNVRGLGKIYRSINPVATFWYIGKSNQKTGDAPNVDLLTTADAKVVICDLAGSNLTLTPTVSFGVTSTPTVSPTGGKLDIRRGQFIETETAFIFGSTGTLYMAQGTLYKVVKGYAVATDEPGSNGVFIPRMQGSANPYVLQGGTIELGGTATGNYFQTLRSNLNGRPSYKYIKYSGTNNYDNVTHTAIDYKNLSNGTVIDSALIITGNAVVDCIDMSTGATSFTGGGGLIMDNGRLRIKSTSDPQPKLAGDTLPYTLTGGTVEFYGTISKQQQLVRAQYRTVNPVKISYYNLDINANAANYDTTIIGDAGNVDMVSSFRLKNALNIYPPAVFRMDESDILEDAVSPTNSMTVHPGAGLLYGNTSGITSSGSSGNVQISGSRTFSSTASYGFVGNNTMVTGNGLPSTVASLYVYRNNIQKLVNLTNSVSVTDSLNFYRGIINTGANKVTMLSGNMNAIKNFDVPFTGNSGVPTYIDDRYVIGNLERNINSTGIYVFPVGDVVSGEAYNPLRLNVISGTGMATAQFIPGDPGSCVAGPVFFTCGSIQKGYNYTDMTTEGRWRMTSSTASVFDYDIYVHPNIKNQNTAPNLWIDSSGTNYLIDYRALKAPNGTTQWDPYANTGDICVSSYYYNILGKGFSGFSDFAPAGGNTNTVSQLPVELISFTSDCQEDGSVMLNWATASEQNSGYFLVEQSLNGTQFNAITEVAAAGNSVSPRNYSVRVPAVSDRTYYRLKMVDLDNTYEYSSTIIANCFGKSGNLGIYYNPDEGIILQSQLTESSRYQLALYDAAGKLVHQENKILDKGMNRYTLDIRKKLAKGIYFFRAVNGTYSYNQKIWIY